MPFQIAYQVRVLSDYFPTRVNDYFPSMNAPRAPPAEAARHAPVASARPTGAILIISLGIPSELWVQHLKDLFCEPTMPNGARPDLADDAFCC